MRTKMILKVGGMAAVAILIVSSGCSQQQKGKLPKEQAKVKPPVCLTGALCPPPPPPQGGDPNEECKALLGDRAVCEATYAGDANLCSVCSVPAEPDQPIIIQNQSSVKTVPDWTSLLGAILIQSSHATTPTPPAGPYAGHFCSKTFASRPAACPVVNTLALRDGGGSFPVLPLLEQPISIRFRNRQGALTSVSNACIYKRGTASIQGCQNIPARHALQLIIRSNPGQPNPIQTND